MKTWVGITIGVVGLGVVATMVYLGFKKPTADTTDEMSSSTNESTTTTTPSSNTTTSNESFPLKKGSKGSKVSKLQEGLNHYITLGRIVSAKLIVDGSFGSKTENALLLLTGMKTADSNLYNEISTKSFKTLAYQPTSTTSSEIV